MKKVVSLFAVLIVFIGLIAGCSNGGTKEGSAEAEKQGGSNEKVDLKMAVFPADQEVFESAYENFKKDHPNIEITFETFPQEQYYEKLRMQLSSGEGYDLFTGQMDNMIDTGLLAPLDDYIQESKMDVSGCLSQAFVGGIYFHLKRVSGF
ncbi:ABC transporter substrate-binding protein, partial [Bacillus sp. V33-4]|uniref:ABC transporter substrate-binding protein n=1 Tax=Bacillus sp. V33-4 TaxID=2054169 RepID=UPI000CAE2CB2